MPPASARAGAGAAGPVGFRVELGPDQSFAGVGRFVPEERAVEDDLAVGEGAFSPAAKCQEAFDVSVGQRPDGADRNS